MKTNIFLKPTHLSISNDRPTICETCSSQTPSGVLLDLIEVEELREVLKDEALRTA